MSLYADSFASVHKALFIRRKKALEIIFTYLQKNDLENLMLYYTSPAIKEALLPPELEYLEGISRRHYGVDSTADKLEKKPSH